MKKNATAGKTAHDFICKPVDQTEIIVRTQNLLRMKEISDDDK